MRFLWFISLCFIGVGLGGIGSARADQTDPALDPLFQELRDGSAIDYADTVREIITIWSRSVSPTSDLLYERALVAIDINDLDLAEALLAHVTGLTPHFAQGWALSGRVQRLKGNGLRARKDFAKALALEPRQFLVRLELAQMAMQAGDRESAYNMLQQALEWNPYLDEARAEAARLRRLLSGDAI